MLYIGTSKYGDSLLRSTVTRGSTTYILEATFGRKGNLVNCLLGINQERWLIDRMVVFVLDDEKLERRFYIECEYQPNVEKEDHFLLETIRILPTYYEDGTIVLEYFRPRLYPDGFHKDDLEYQKRGHLKNRFLHFLRPGGYYRYDYSEMDNQYKDCYQIVCPRTLPDEKELTFLIEQIKEWNERYPRDLKSLELEHMKEVLQRISQCRNEEEPEQISFGKQLQLIYRDRLAYYPKIGYNGTNQTTKKQKSISSTD